MELYGPVRADKNVGMGKASVTLSMNWKGTPVASTTHAMHVSDAVGGPSLAVSSRLIRSLPHADRKAVVSGVRFTPKGTLFTSGYPSGIIQVWDPLSGKEVRRIDSPRGASYGDEYALPSADFARLFVPISGRKVIRVENDPKQPWLIEYDSKVLAWDLATGKPKPAVKGRTGFGMIIGYLSPDGGRLISLELAGGTQSPAIYGLRMTDLITGRSWKLVEGNGTATFAPDGKRAYVAVRGDENKGCLLVFDREGKELPPLSRRGELRFSSPTISSDGKWLVAYGSKPRSEKARLILFDLEAGKEVGEFVGGGTSYTFSPDSRRLATGDREGTIKVFDVAKRSLVLEHESKGMHTGGSLAFTKDGRRLAVSVQEKTDQDRSRDPDPLDLPQPRIYLFDLTKAKSAPEEIVCPHGWAGAVAFSPDGKILAAGSAGAVHLFDVSGPAR